jgi:hypothetical protein
VSAQVFLPLALTAASRMLEPLLTNAETSRQFVERGGADILLKIYQLPKLTVRSAGGWCVLLTSSCPVVCMSLLGWAVDTFSAFKHCTGKPHHHLLPRHILC